MEYRARLVAPIRMRHLILFGLLTAVAVAAPRKFSSGENRTHLIELYSSEGCSSCPPAEAWLGGFRDAPGLWRDFVPIAFHVSYWDRLGWPDRFATKENTARQYSYANLWHGDSVYTPELVLDGTEWRSAFEGNPPPASSEKAGMLAVDYADDGVCRVTFSLSGDYEMHAALLGGGIFSSIRAGENKGRTLHHEFVVLAIKSARLTAGAAELSLPKSTDKTIARQALAIWVTQGSELAPRQATGGWVE